MGWYEAIKDVITVAERLKDAELKQTLATVRMEGAKLAEENARLREELVALRERLCAEAAILHRDNVYWKRVEGAPEEGPFCPTCWDGERKPVRMAEWAEDLWWKCPVCRCSVQRPGMAPPEPRPSRPEPWQRDWISSRFR